MSRAVENEYKFCTYGELSYQVTVNKLEAFLDMHDMAYSEKHRTSVDTYYDSDDLALFHGGCILRQKVSSTGKIKLTAKKPISDIDEMMSREEIEILSDGSIDSLLSFGKEIFPDLKVVPEPILTIETERTAFYYKDGSEIMMSLDTCRYVNGSRVKEFLEIEIESMGETTERGFDRIGMRGFVKDELGFDPVVKSKYHRGIEWRLSDNDQI